MRFERTEQLGAAVAIPAHVVETEVLQFRRRGVIRNGAEPEALRGEERERLAHAGDRLHSPEHVDPLPVDHLFRERGRLGDGNAEALRDELVLRETNIGQRSERANFLPRGEERLEEARVAHRGPREDHLHLPHVEERAVDVEGERADHGRDVTSPRGTAPGSSPASRARLSRPARGGGPRRSPGTDGARARGPAVRRRGARLTRRSRSRGPRRMPPRTHRAPPAPRGDRRSRRARRSAEDRPSRPSRPRR